VERVRKSGKKRGETSFFPALSLAIFSLALHYLNDAWNRLIEFAPSTFAPFALFSAYFLGEKGRSALMQIRKK